MEKKRIEVVAAVVRDANRFLATQRGYGEFHGLWEFPGGKIEPGESREEALIREIREELDAVVRIEDFLTTVTYDYPGFYLTMHCYLCTLNSVQMVLHVHDQIRWFDLSEWKTINWLPADILVVEALERYLNEEDQNTIGI